MNELQVTVKQTPGEIQWNYEELKQELASQMETYKSIVYTDENIGEAKNDVAFLRKLSREVNARKIEIKNECLKPYVLIEDQAKELMALIDEPIALIDKKVKDFERRRREEKKEKIMKVMFETFSDLPDDIRKRLECKAYDSRWENATTSEKTYREAIQKAHDETVEALRILDNIDDDFKAEVMSVYKIDLNLTGAMSKAQELQRQKERLIERERIRKEAEIARARVQEEARLEKERMLQEQKKAPEPDPKPAATVQKPVQTETVPETKQKPAPGSRVILFTGSDEQLKKVLGYIKFIGAGYELR